MSFTINERTRTLCLVIAAVSIAVYANSLLNGFALDDNFIIRGNPRVHSPASLTDVWLTPYWPGVGEQLGLYRPAIIALYAVQWAIGGGEAWLFHAVNVALHAVVSVLVFVLLRRAAGTVAAFVGALIFAVHPIHTEAVANIVGQAELVAALAVLAACVIHSGRPDGLRVSWWRRCALVALFALALATKESAVVLPALLVVMDLAQRRVRLTVKGAADYADAMLMPLFLLAATLAFYLIIRYDVMGGALIGLDAAPSMPYLREEHRVLNALRAFPEFMRLLLFPLDLAVDYSPAALLPVDTVRPMVMLGALLLSGLAILALLTPWIPAAGLTAAWFLVSIITVSNLFFPIGVVIAERTLYLPSVAVAALVAFAWSAAASRLPPTRRWAAPVLATLVIVALGARTWVRNPVWKDTNAVWASMLRDQPQSYRTHWLFAIGLWNNERFNEAEDRFRFAIRIYDRDSQLITEYGNFLIGRGRYDDAIPLLENAHEMRPEFVRTTVVLMHAYLGAGRYPDAIRTAHVARHTGADPATTLPAIAFAHQQLGEVPEAIAAWRLATAYTDPDKWRLRAHLARASAAAGLDDAARAVFAGIRADIDDPAAHVVVDSMELALHTGCYRRAADRTRTAKALLPPELPLAHECDPLDHWFEFIVRGQDVRAQNANASQNATALPPAGPGSIPQE